MNELTKKTLAQIVTNDHRAAAIFEKYNLDFCCKGKRSLEQACVEQKLPINEVVHDLTGALTTNGTDSVRIPFDNITLSQLVDYIINTHHSYVKKEIPLISQYVQKISSKHGTRHPELYKIFDLVDAIQEEMEDHMKKEENVLFPRIKELESIASDKQGNFKLSSTYLLAPITMMEMEHDHAGSLLSEIRHFSNNFMPPEDACTTYKLAFASLQAFEMDLHQHVHLENNILFPKAIEMMRTIKMSVLN